MCVVRIVLGILGIMVHPLLGFAECFPAAPTCSCNLAAQTCTFAVQGDEPTTVLDGPPITDLALNRVYWYRTGPYPDGEKYGAEQWTEITANPTGGVHHSLDVTVPVPSGGYFEAHVHGNFQRATGEHFSFGSMYTIRLLNGAAPSPTPPSAPNGVIVR